MTTKLIDATNAGFTGDDAVSAGNITIPYPWEAPTYTPNYSSGSTVTILGGSSPNNDVELRALKSGYLVKIKGDEHAVESLEKVFKLIKELYDVKGKK